MNIIERSFNKKDKTLPTTKEIVESSILDNLNYRFFYTNNSWFVMNHEFIKEMSSLIKFIGFTNFELACGSGWLTYWLKKYGVKNIKCSDSHKWTEKHIYTDIKKKDAVEIVKENIGRSLFILSWPPYNNSLAEDVWSSMQKGQYLLYIGEYKNGCNANNNFFNLIKDYEYEGINYFKACKNSFLRFKYLHDHVYLYRK